MSLSAADYEKRFGQRFTMGSSTNALGYGINNKYYPPLKNFNNMNTWIERKMALTFHAPPNPMLPVMYYLMGFASTDANDWGYLEFAWEWFVNLCWNLSYFLTFFIPVDLILASLSKSWEPLLQNILFYVPVLNWFTYPFMFVWCNIFGCQLENGWNYQWFLKSRH